jgi:hypothetical protein
LRRSFDIAQFDGALKGHLGATIAGHA